MLICLLIFNIRSIIRLLILNLLIMKIRPLGDRVVLKLLEADTKTESGIYIPDTADKEKPEQGKIVAIGDGAKIKKLGLKEKMTILFGKYSGSDVEIDGEEYKVVGEEDILAVLE